MLEDIGEDVLFSKEEIDALEDRSEEREVRGKIGQCGLCEDS